jgi:hypothetical protein
LKKKGYEDVGWEGDKSIGLGDDFDEEDDPLDDFLPTPLANPLK